MLILKVRGKFYMSKDIPLFSVDISNNCYEFAFILVKLAKEPDIIVCYFEIQFIEFRTESRIVF
jgi:hypothetical protein